MASCHRGGSFDPVYPNGEIRQDDVRGVVRLRGTGDGSGAVTCRRCNERSARPIAVAGITRQEEGRSHERVLLVPNRQGPAGQAARREGGAYRPRRRAGVGAATRR